MHPSLLSLLLAHFLYIMVYLLLYLPIVLYIYIYIVFALPSLGPGWLPKNGEYYDTLSKYIDMVGLVESCIYVNMVGGPMGHAGGMSMSDIRHDIISLFVTGTIPCYRLLTNVVVSIQRPDSSLESAKPFYISVKDKDTLAVASLPEKIIPNRGFVSPGTKVLKAFQDCEESAIHHNCSVCYRGRLFRS